MNLQFFAKRLGYTLFMLVFIITINFLLFRLMPGDPLSTLSKELLTSPEARAAMEAKYGLDKPLIVQYVNYVKQLLTFNFGTSFYYNNDVRLLLVDKMSNSALLAGVAIPLGILLGITTGVVASARRGKKLDIGLTSTTMFIYAIPSFWLGMIFLSLFAVKLRWVPVSGMTVAGAKYTSYAAYYKDLLNHMIMPVITYALAIYGSYMLHMRNTMIDVFTEDFVLTARAKGLSENQVIRRHVVPNALLPMATVVIMSLALMFTGAFSIEVLYSWPGMGRLMVDSVTRRDYPVLQASNYIIALVVILANFVIDVAYSYLDPRVRIE
ncbi:MAG: ABC transporter permease [Bacillota bacterium]|jgi:peptide/nickel transport system permease protein